MRVRTLIQKLEAIELKHGSGARICVDTKALRDSCNDVWQIVDVSKVDVDTIEQVDGDGFRKENKDGSTRVCKCVILR
jgi:hypothetical protein